VFTADHLIGPVGEFQQIVGKAWRWVERSPETLGDVRIAPTGPATSYGYWNWAKRSRAGARLGPAVREKGPARRARPSIQRGPERYLWNSGMFVWRAATLLDSIRRYRPLVQ